MKRVLALALLALPLLAEAETIYLCKAYSGGMFWSNKYCGQQQATVERMVNVPESLPWDQKVQLAEQNRANGAALVANPAPATTAAPNVNMAPRQSECSSINAGIANLDAQARQPHPGPSQDAIAAQRRKLRDRQAQFGC